ncbi:MAG: uroporphyrinogen decarboxylase family protein [Bryobacteraceae bacterium]
MDHEARSFSERRPVKRRERVMAALRRQSVDQPPVINPTSLATLELMDIAGASFPDAHREPEAMARLALAGHANLGYDSVMPVFSIVQESSALGCRITWGERAGWPVAKGHDPAWNGPADIRIPRDWLRHPDIQCVLSAIRTLKGLVGDSAAVIGKTMGPWTLAYHCFGLENFLLMSVDDPGMTRRCLSTQNDNVLFAQSRNVLLTPSRLGRCKKDSY